jgi:hypothetical protein
MRQGLRVRRPLEMERVPLRVLPPSAAARRFRSRAMDHRVRWGAPHPVQTELRGLRLQALRLRVPLLQVPLLRVLQVPELQVPLHPAG